MPDRKVKRRRPARFGCLSIGSPCDADDLGIVAKGMVMECSRFVRLGPGPSYFDRCEAGDVLGNNGSGAMAPEPTNVHG